MANMTTVTGTWQTFRDEAPEVAAKVEARFRAHTHHVMATLRADGSPRVSGTEVVLDGDDLFLGSMWRSRKALDLRRDPRVAVHSNPGDETMEGGDAKLSAFAAEVPDDHPAKVALRGEEADGDGGPPEPFHLFRLDLREVVLTEVDQEAGVLHVHLWRPGHGISSTTVR